MDRWVVFCSLRFCDARIDSLRRGFKYFSNWRTITAVMLARNGDWHSDEKTSAPGACSSVRFFAPLYRFECQFNQFFFRRLVRPFPSDYSIRATTKRICEENVKMQMPCLRQPTTYRCNEIHVVQCTHFIRQSNHSLSLSIVNFRSLIRWASTANCIFSGMAVVRFLRIFAYKYLQWLPIAAIRQRRPTVEWGNNWRIDSIWWDRARTIGV